MQSNTTAITLSQSGSPLSVGNELQAGAGDSLSISYVVTGSPMTLTISVIGIKKAFGEIAVLDSITGTSNTVRTVTLSDTFDFFRFVATWTTSGGANVSVSASVTSTGSGTSFDSTLLPAQQSYSV